MAIELLNTSDSDIQQINKINENFQTLNNILNPSAGTSISSLSSTLAQQITDTVMSDRLFVRYLNAQCMEVNMANIQWSNITNAAISNLISQNLWLPVTSETKAKIIDLFTNEDSETDYDKLSGGLEEGLFVSSDSSENPKYWNLHIGKLIDCVAYVLSTSHIEDILDRCCTFTNNANSIFTFDTSSNTVRIKGIIADSIATGELTASVIKIVGDDGLCYKYNIGNNGTLEETIGKLEDMTGEEWDADKVKQLQQFMGTDIVAGTIGAERLTINDLAAIKDAGQDGHLCGFSLDGTNIKSSEVVISGDYSVENPTGQGFLANVKGNFFAGIKKVTGASDNYILVSQTASDSQANTTASAKVEIAADNIVLGNMRLIKRSNGNMAFKFVTN